VRGITLTPIGGTIVAMVAAAVGIVPALGREFPAQAELRRDLAHLMTLIGQDEARRIP
jgi:hypothetical protein